MPPDYAAPDYAAITGRIRAHYRNPGPRAGVEGRPGPFGFYTKHRHDPDLDSIALDPLNTDQIPALLDDLRAYFDHRPVRIYIDDRALERDLRDALKTAGCTHRHDLVYLAHTGAATAVQPAPDLTIEEVTADALAESEIARIKAFADSEEEPDADEVAASLPSLKLDLASGNRYLIGRIGTEAAATAGWDEGPDRLVFNLATRVPFRHRGIARHLLSHMIADTYKNGYHSITIFTDPTDSPVQFYRRMGFTEEVYWQARYLYTPAS